MCYLRAVWYKLLWTSSTTKYFKIHISKYCYVSQGPVSQHLIFVISSALISCYQYITHIRCNNMLFLYSTQILSYAKVIWYLLHFVNKTVLCIMADYVHLTHRDRGRFNNAYELLTLRALKISMFHKRFIFQCMGKIFCVEFQRYPLKFHTKYLTHTLKDMTFIQHWNFKSS